MPSLGEGKFTLGLQEDAFNQHLTSTAAVKLDKAAGQECHRPPRRGGRCRKAN